MCTEEYVRPTKQNLSMVCMHLTNYAVNKHNANFLVSAGVLDLVLVRNKNDCVCVTSTHCCNSTSVCPACSRNCTLQVRFLFISTIFQPSYRVCMYTVATVGKEQRGISRRRFEAQPVVVHVLGPRQLWWPEGGLAVAQNG